MSGCTTFRDNPLEHEDQQRIMFDAISVTNETSYHSHSSLRNMIERSFGVLKMKWRILLKLPKYSVNKQSKIIVACMTLHNFIRDNNINDADFQSRIKKMVQMDLNLAQVKEVLLVTWIWVLCVML